MLSHLEQAVYRRWAGQKSQSSGTQSPSHHDFTQKEERRGGTTKREKAGLSVGPPAFKQQTALPYTSLATLTWDSRKIITRWAIAAAYQRQDPLGRSEAKRGGTLARCPATPGPMTGFTVPLSPHSQEVWKSNQTQHHRASSQTLMCRERVVGLQQLGAARPVLG